MIRSHDTWRDRAKAVIAQIVAEHAGADEKTLRKVLRERYPFGERAMFPYKVWCQEVAIATGAAARKRAKEQDESLGGENLYGN